MKESYLFFNGAGEVDERGVEGLDIAAGEVFKEAAEGDEMVSLSNGFEAVAGGVDFETVEFEAELAEDIGGDVGGLDNVAV